MENDPLLTPPPKIWNFPYVSSLFFLKASLMVPSPYSCLLTFTLMLKSCGWWWVQLDYGVSSGPFWTMNFEFQDLGLAIIC